jgi:hypothetical protein
LEAGPKWPASSFGQFVSRQLTFIVALSIFFPVFLQEAECQSLSRFSFASNAVSQRVGKQKLWTTIERQIVARHLEKANSEYPGLIERCGEFSVLRLDRIDHTSFVAGGTLPGYICIADKFFENSRTQQYRTMLHELVHLADYGFIVSDSDSWQKLSKQFRSAEDPWLEPSLQEKLAQRFSIIATEKSQKSLDKVFAKTISPLLLNKDSTVQLFTECCISGAAERINKHYERAIEQFEQAERLIPTSPTPNVNLTYCYMSKKKYPEAYVESKKAFEKFKKLRTPVYEPRYINLLLTQAKLLCAFKNYRHAEAAAKLILSYSPPKDIANQAKRIIQFVNEKK